MKKLTLIILTFILTNYGKTQDLQLDIHAHKLADFITLEESLGSKRQENTHQHILAPGITQPIIYRRKQNKVPDLLAFYFYYEKDSTIDNILYEWDDSNFTGFVENAKKSSTEVAGFIEKYQQIYKQIAAVYGESKQEGDFTNLALINEGLTREDNWKPNDSTEIQLYTTLSHKYEKHGPVTTKPTYRIRLYVSNTKVPGEKGLQMTGLFEMASLSEERVQILDSVAQGFLLAMKVKKYEEAKNYLSDRIRQSVTNAQMQQLSKVVDFQQSFDLYSKTVQMGIDGSSFSVLQYKHSNDTNTPPMEMIKFTFDDGNKLLGVHPLKRF